MALIRRSIRIEVLDWDWSVLVFRLVMVLYLVSGIAYQVPAVYLLTDDLTHRQGCSSCVATRIQPIEWLLADSLELYN